MASGYINSAGTDLDDLYDLADQGSTGKTFGILVSDGTDIGARYAPASEGSAGDAVGIIGANGESVGPQFRKKGSSNLLWRAVMTAGYLKKDSDWWYGRTGYGRYGGRPDLSFGDLVVTYNYIGLGSITHICEQDPEYQEFWVVTNNKNLAGCYCYLNGEKYGQFASTGNLIEKTRRRIIKGNTYTVEFRRS